MNSTVSFTIDVEQDFGGRLDSYRGVTEGLPILLDIFKQYGVKATFFVTEHIVMDCPNNIKEIIHKGHEVGSHFMDHVKLSEHSPLVLEYGLQAQGLWHLIKGFDDCAGFRAPYFMPPKHMARSLESSGFVYDSSVVSGAYFPGRYNYLKVPKNPYHPCKEDIRHPGNLKLMELPVSTIPYFHLPLGLSYLHRNYNFFKKFLKFDQEHIVMYAHAHELVKDFKVPGLFGSNKGNIEIMEDLICAVFKNRTTVTMRDAACTFTK